MRAAFKGQRLVDHFIDIIPIQEVSINTPIEKLNEILLEDKRAAKQCALVVVHEMLANADYIYGGRDAQTGKTARENYIEYWQEVKEAIEKA